jgi:3-hydroxybutyryl-CoA dehydrogenase
MNAPDDGNSVAVEPGSRPMAVVGAGTLGRRIALMLATRGTEVRVFDTSPDQQSAAVDFVQSELPAVVGRMPGASAGQAVVSRQLASAVTDAWLVVEALPERLDLKKQVFADLDRLAPADAILATNSSSYPSSQLLDHVTRPERVVNTHFYMPPQRNAVEIMSSGRTDDRIIDLLMSTLPAYGLVPFHVREQSIGFIFNRIWGAIKREALAVVAEGVATPEEGDGIYKLCLGAPQGPFLMMDFVGLDVVLDIEEHYASVRKGLPESPRRLLRDYIDQGRLGLKSGQGFYNWPQPPQDPAATN